VFGEANFGGTDMDGHLLLVGNDLGTLLRLCASLSGYYATTTVAPTPFFGGRVRESMDESFDARVVVLGAGDLDPIELESLRQCAVEILVVAADARSEAARTLRGDGRLVLGVAEPAPILHASLFTLRHEERSVREAHG
jgi:hypothetical protein